MVQKYDRGTLVLLGRYRFMVQSKKGRRGDDVLTAFRPNGLGWKQHDAGIRSLSAYELTGYK
ncbi:hypothetical protein MPTK1_3g16990 [Marchantia polymorpha subsp. ruderalis]|uniref:Uncharacterized protein n=2 Tax=Marchantia polymorpha TaxID=3197 RepID=A0AAF6B1N2_MARPO|nr:hypothetical protein MARPO_0039s0095 [Marchantia polymorpha]BBN05916.1 hypothetical protein Mp_3g16990 [Marchantia polymorpha subsp. ruderalis]|eukprot:PTQ40608.1 hypothetical protein MARPO_0039s0095 [Marchantia polymorpha]